MYFFFLSGIYSQWKAAKHGVNFNHLLQKEGKFRTPTEHFITFISSNIEEKNTFSAYWIYTSCDKVMQIIHFSSP